MNDKIECKVCGTPTDVRFNIDFTTEPICESCAESVFVQQAVSYVRVKKPSGLQIDLGILREVNDKIPVKELVTLINRAVKTIQ